MYNSDWELIQACRQGDTCAWQHVLDKYERLVFSIALNYGLTQEDAADITQLTFTIFMQNLDDLAEDSNLSAWLATVARRHTWRLLAQGKREGTSAYEDVRETALRIPDESGKQAMQRWELTEWLQQGFAGLDDRCTKLLLALYFSPVKKTYAEISEMLDMPVGSIGPTRARCLERLKGLLTAKE